MTTGNVVQFSAPVPFNEAQEPIRSCWALGYHDGMNNVDLQPGEEGLEALAAGTRSNLAGLNGEMAACMVRAGELDAKTTAVNSLLLPGAGRQRIGVAAWVVAAFYLCLAFLTFGADLPLSALTVGEALGKGTNLSSIQMLFLQTATVWSLGLTLCLIGFCLKILVDVLDHRRIHHWWETVLVAAACFLCGISLYGVSELRDSMGRQQIAAQEMRVAYSAVPRDKDRDARAVTTAVKAANNMSEWTAFTLMWVTVTLPVLSAVAVIVAFRQIRVYRGHNRALEVLSGLPDELAEQANRRVRLKFAIDEEEQRLEQAENGQHSNEFKQRAAAAYRHGFATGEATRLAPLVNGGTYMKMLAKLNQRRA